MNHQFMHDVDAGLSQSQKSLPSKYFYNERGDQLFMQIMSLPEYYLTRAELEIFQTQAHDIIHTLNVCKHTPFELIELGAGDGSKTQHLLNALIKQGYQFDYLPIDISEHVLTHLDSTLRQKLPSLSIKAQQGDYFDILHQLSHGNKPKIVLFLGSNLGNLTDQQASLFIDSLGTHLSDQDKIILGVDLIKTADIVLPAYNDSQGITQAFNLNLLQRINQELGANFITEQFSHLAQYTEKEGIAKSYLVSNIAQKVHIKTINKDYSFNKGEKIHVEISRKYNQKILLNILATTPFKIEKKFTDSRHYFCDLILTKYDELSL